MNTKAIYFLSILFSILTSTNVLSQHKSIFKNNYTFKSKLKDNKRVQVKSFTDKKTYKLSDTIRLIVESNKLFEKSPLTKLALPNLKKGLSRTGTEINAGKIHTYYLTEYFPVKTGTIKIPSIKTTIKNKSYKTRKIKITIIED